MTHYPKSRLNSSERYAEAQPYLINPKPSEITLKLETQGHVLLLEKRTL